MAKRPKLTAKKRKILGRKVKKLRKEGLIPGNVYGKGVKSIPISVDRHSFLPIFEETGETGLLDLVVDNQKLRTVLVSQVQRHPLTSEVLHIDLRQVSLTERVTAEIPIELVGISPVVEEKRGLLLTILSEVEVEALPTDLPESIKVDVSGLREVDDAVKVGDVQVGDKVKILADPGEILVKIGPLVTAEVEEEIKAEEEAAEAAGVAAEKEKKAEEPEEGLKGKPPVEEGARDQETS